MANRAQKRKQQKAKKRRERVAKQKATGRLALRRASAGGAPPPLDAPDFLDGGDDSEGSAMYSGRVDDGRHWVDVAVDLGERGAFYPLADPSRPGTLPTDISWGPGATPKERLTLARLLLVDCLGEEYAAEIDEHARFADEVLRPYPTDQEWEIEDDSLVAWANGASLVLLPPGDADVEDESERERPGSLQT